MLEAGEVEGNFGDCPTFLPKTDILQWVDYYVRGGCPSSNKY